MGDDQLRVGVVVPTGRPPAWSCRSVQALAAEPGVRLTTVFHPASPASRAPGISARLIERAGRRRSVALRPSEPPPALDPLPLLTLKPAASTLGAAPTISPGSLTGQVAHRSRDRASREVATPARLDVLVDLAGVDGLAGELAALARLGLWRFEFGPERVGAAGPVGLPDLLGGRPTADIRLVAHTADGCATVLRAGTVATVAHSWVRHRDRLLLRGTNWPALACRDALAGQVGEQSALPPGDPAPRSRMARLAWRTLHAQAARAVRFLEEAQWHVGVVDVPIEAFLRPTELPPPTWLPGPPRRAFYADPFLCPGRRRVIVERFGLRDRTGTLCTLDLARPGGPPRPVAGPGHHISYPYVVEHAGQAYCIPETAEVDEVGLYRLVGEPLRLEKVTTLVEGVAAIDPTLTFHDERWWLFFTDGCSDDDADLHVWYATELCGPWQAHQRNPVKVDVRSSRPAGTPFCCDGTLFRPAMDNSVSYGGRVVLNRVVRLTPDQFEEIEAAVVPPFPGTFHRGIHTLAAAGSFTIVDGKRRRIVPSALPAKLRAHRAGRPAR